MKTEPDRKLASPCAYPVNVPVKPLSPKEVGFYWSADRQSLMECGLKNGQVDPNQVTEDRDQ